MSDYPMFQEIINEINSRPDADPAKILEEYISPLVDVCNDINQWLPANVSEPEWYEKFLDRLARFDVDLSPIWLENRANLTMPIKPTH